MKKVINPIDSDLLEKELTKERFLRRTNKGNNEIYIFKYDEAPKLMLEVARLRELSFRAGGGGSGAELDLDAYD